MERNTKKIVVKALSTYWPRSHATIPPKVHVPEPLPDPIEPESWWKTCWLNPKRKKNIYDLPSIRQYDIIG